jgi:serine phosphatase RsbU (regulator of sigma subunit)
MPLNPKNRLTLTYWIALSLIALLSIVSYILMRVSLQTKEADSRLLNLAGRQRMLSERLIKTALILEHPLRNKPFDENKGELEQSFDQWVQIQIGLEKGDKHIGLPGKNSPEATKILNEMYQSFSILKKAFEIILNTQYEEFNMRPKIKIAIDMLVSYDEKYGKYMNDLIDLYDKEAKQRLERSQYLAFSVGILTLIVLALELIFIFRPSVRKTIEYLTEIQESNIKLEKMQKLNQENMVKLSEFNEQLQDKNSILEEATKVLDIKNKEIRRQKDYLENQSKELTIKNENILNSLRYARRIQEAILPETKEWEKFFDETMVFYQPKDIVSGDFYWFSEKKYSNLLNPVHRQLILVVADCTGHGVPGALMTMLGSALLNEIVNEKNITNPAEILFHLDKKIIEQLKHNNSLDTERKRLHNEGMDIGVVNISFPDGTIKFAGSHHDLLQVKNGNMIVHKGNKIAIGSTHHRVEKNFELTETKAQNGDTFYMFTDGFPDQYGELLQRKYMSKRFKEFITSIAHLPLSIQKEKLQEEFEDWKGKANQTDDILIVGWRW